MLDLTSQPAAPAVELGSDDVLKKGYLPQSVDRFNTDLSFHINEFPLGDIENYRLCRAAYSLALQKSGSSVYASWDRWAPWEKHYHQAMAKVQYKTGQNEYVSGQDGGFLAPEIWSQKLIGLLRSFTIFDKLPIQRLPMPARELKLPKVMLDVTISYPGENTAPTPTVFQFGQVSYTAHKAVGIVNGSNDWIRDAPEATDVLWQQEAALALAQDRDNQALNGLGGGTPVGILNMPAVPKTYVGTSATASIQLSANHGTPSFLHISQLRSKVTALSSVASVSAGQAKVTGMIAHSRFEQTVHTLAAAASAWTDAQGRPFWMTDLNGNGVDPGSGLLGVPWALTNLLTTTSTDGGGSTSSYIIAGAWQHYVLFEALDFGFDATLEGQGFANDQTQVKFVHRWDGAPTHPEAFAILAGCDQ